MKYSINCDYYYIIIDEPSKIELEKNESNIDHLHVPSTSKSISPIIEDSIFSNKSDVDQQDITNLSYLESKYGTINNNSRPTDSDHSCDSFSEKSFDLTPEEIPSSSIEISEGDSTKYVFNLITLTTGFNLI